MTARFISILLLSLCLFLLYPGLASALTPTVSKMACVMLSGVVRNRGSDPQRGAEASLPSLVRIHGYHSEARSFHCGLRRSRRAIFLARVHPFSCVSRAKALWTSSQDSK